MNKKVEYIMRWAFIYCKIESSKYITLDELIIAVRNKMEIFSTTFVGISKRTIERDIQEIKAMGLGIEYSKTKKGYYIPNDEKVDSEFACLRNHFKFLNSFNIKEHIPNFVLTESREPRGSRHIFSLIHAIENNLIVELDYRKFDNTSKRRKLKSYGLKEFKGRWYLLAQEIEGKLEERGLIKTWGLDRCFDINITSLKFRPDANLDIKKIFKDCYGIYSNLEEQAEDVILSFTPEIGRFVKADPWHESQEVILENEVEIRIKLHVVISHDFIEQALSLCENMKVISPKSLREKIVQILRKSIEINTNTGE